MGRREILPLVVATMAVMISYEAVADGFVRKREPRNYMPTFGRYQHESDLNEEMREYCQIECDGIPPNAYYTMADTIPGTQISGYIPEDLTCGGEFYISPREYDEYKTNSMYDLIMYNVNLSRQTRAIIATNEWYRALESVEPWPELKAELDRYKMRACEIDFWGLFFGALVYESPVKSGKIPLLVYIPGDGEIGEDYTRQFHQRKLFDLVTSEKFQKEHPCHLVALSPVEPDEDGVILSDRAFQRRAYRMVHKVGKEILNDRVDWSRVYLVGFSYGAGKALDMALHYPTKYAAGIFVAGAIPPIEHTIKLRGDDMPPQNYWYVANEDDVFSKEEYWRTNAAKLKAYINSHNGDCRVSFFPMAKGHNAWDRAWDREELWNWLFSKKSGAKPSNSVPMQLPDPKCTASVEASEPAYSANRVVDMLRNTYYAPARPFTQNDWWQVECSRPLTGKVVVISGDAAGKRLLTNGIVESSQDGARWHHAGVFSKKNGICEFKPQKGSRFIRVRVKNSSVTDFAIRDVCYYPAR